MDSLALRHLGSPRKRSTEVIDPLEKSRDFFAYISYWLCSFLQIHQDAHETNSLPATLSISSFYLEEDISRAIITSPRDFSGCPVVGTSSFNVGDANSISGQGAKISHASWPKNQNIRQKQYCNKFNKDFSKEKKKMGTLFWKNYNFLKFDSLNFRVRKGLANSCPKSFMWTHMDSKPQRDEGIQLKPHNKAGDEVAPSHTLLALSHCEWLKFLLAIIKACYLH